MTRRVTRKAVAAAELPWTEVHRLACAGAVALLPIGSTEAHGPHLPLNVDVVVSLEVCRRASLRLEARGTPSVIFPPIAYGVTDFAASFAGTVTVGRGTMLAYLSDVLRGIASHGFARIAVVNHHLEPAHFRVVHEAAQHAASESKASIVVPDHRRPPFASQLGEEFTRGGSHAGRYETSLMLAAAPSLVDEDVRAKLADLPVDLPAKIRAGARTFLDCGGDQAYFGSPAAASAHEGHRLLDLLAAATEASLTPAS